MERVFFVNESLKKEILELIDRYEKEYGVEFIAARLESAFSVVTQQKEIHIALGLKDMEVK